MQQWENQWETGNKDKIQNTSWTSLSRENKIHNPDVKRSTKISRQQGN